VTAQLGLRHFLLLREIPQKVQKLAAHRSLASGVVGRIGPVPVGSPNTSASIYLSRF
jgi:hypothetical protein